MSSGKLHSPPCGGDVREADRGGYMPHRKVPPINRRNARRMRTEMTDAERRLWNQLRAHRLDQLGFRRQMPIDNYIADFACPELKLVVEVDGMQHAMPGRAERDRQRTRHLGKTGWQVVRFWNDEVMNDLDNVCDHIVLMATEIRKGPPLSPAVTSPPQGGRVERAYFTGGCQCGAVRYRFAELGRASICHCRMCQKAFGNYFAPLVEVENFEWTRGERAAYASSNISDRGFYRDCGTPLTLETPQENSVVFEVAIGSMDNPAAVSIDYQVNTNDRIDVVMHLSGIPDAGPERQMENDAWNANVISNQHPDHDTADWIVKGRQ